MFTLVIVEDEELIRKELLITIDWEAIGCRIIGDAPDGVSGEQMICSLSPDIVITDIRLPGQSGLKMLGKTHPRASVIISGYGEFKLAQEAIRLGVSEYLLKPVDHEELIRVVKDICRRLEEQEDTHPSYETLSVQQPSVKAAMDFIDEHYPEDISIYCVARHLGLSDSHLSHLFKEHSGYTVLEYLQQRRIRTAMQLLKDTQLQVTEIYQQCGFASGSYFSKIFRKFTGVTPREYRNGRS